MGMVKSLVIGCIALFACAGAGWAQTEGLPPDQVAKIDEAVAQWMAKHRAPALSVAVVVDGVLRLEKGFGFADPDGKAPATEATVYRLASITKSMTAAAVMQLAEQDRLDLDAPIQKYCPTYPEKPWPVTARLLLTHLAGVRHHSIWESLFPNTHHYGSVQAALSNFKDDDLLQEPGTKYSYSSPGYVVLGCAIEGASGVPYAAYMHEHIFVPAGMTRTAPDDVTRTNLNQAKPYSKGRIYKYFRKFPRVTEAPALDASDRLPAGGFVSTPGDIARFAIALQAGKLVTRESLAQIWAHPKLKDGTALPYGFGWFIKDATETRPMNVSNDGGQPGTRTYVLMIPDKGFVVALMTNLESASCEELVPLIREIVLNERQITDLGGACPQDTKSDRSAWRWHRQKA